MNVARAIAIDRKLRVVRRVASMRCGNLMCVNPAHVYTRTRAAAVRQATSGPQGIRLRRAIAEGQRRRSSTLTPDDVQDIKLSDATCVDLAKRYGVSPSTISNIRCGRRWALIDTMWNGLML